jgi:pyruvate formate lyase activating enzyme
MSATAIALPAALPTPAGAHGLRIGGLTPLTTLDFPGELAAVVFCQGCPWRCRYCQNGDLLPTRREGLIPWSRVRDLLDRRLGLLDAVVFSGGEPTLQAALPSAMAEVKALGFKVGLHTAGTYPQRLRLLLPWLDWVGLDIKALPEDYQAVTGVPRSGERAWESLGLLLGAGVALEVRTTPMPGLDSTTYLDRLMRRLADAGVREYVLQRCHTEHSLDPGLRGQVPAAPLVPTRTPLEHVLLRTA